MDPITGASSPITSNHGDGPHGKYEIRAMIEKTKQGPGLRGIRIWTRPTANMGPLLSEFSTTAAIQAQGPGRCVHPCTKQLT